MDKLSFIIFGLLVTGFWADLLWAGLFIILWFTPMDFIFLFFNMYIFGLLSISSVILVHKPYSLLGPFMTPALSNAFIITSFLLWVAYLWLLSKLKHNRFMHASNGNIFGFVITLVGIVLSSKLKFNYASFIIYSAYSLIEGIAIDEFLYAQSFINNPTFAIFAEVFTFRFLTPLFISVLNYFVALIGDEQLAYAVQNLGVFLSLGQSILTIYILTVLWLNVVSFAVTLPPFVLLILLAGILAFTSMLVYSIIINFVALLYTAFTGKVADNLDFRTQRFAIKVYRTILSLLDVLLSPTLAQSVVYYFMIKVRLFLSLPTLLWLSVFDDADYIYGGRGRQNYYVFERMILSISLFFSRLIGSEVIIYFFFGTLLFIFSFSSFILFFTSGLEPFYIVFSFIIEFLYMTPLARTFYTETTHAMRVVYINIYFSSSMFTRLEPIPFVRNGDFMFFTERTMI
jgi:hypothetical protein